MKNLHVGMPLILLMVGVYSNTNVFAQPGLAANPRSVDYYITYALEHNPGLKALYDDLDVKKNEAGLAAALPDPMVMGTVKSGEISGIGISQMVMWPGKLIAMKRAGLRGAEAQEYRIAATMASIEADVRSLYASLYLIGQTISRQKENLELLKQFEAVARAQYIASSVPRSPSSSVNSSQTQAGGGSSMGGMSGSSSSSVNATGAMGAMGSSSMSSSQPGQSAVLKIQVEQAMLEDKIRNEESRAHSLIEGFKALLGADSTMQIGLPEKLSPPQFSFTDEQVLRVVNEKNPQILEMEKHLAAASAMVSAAKQGYLPDFIFGVEYMPAVGSGSSEANSMGSSSSANLSASVSMTIPLWVGKKSKEIDKAKKMESGMRNELNDMRNMAISETKTLLSDLHDSKRRVDLYRHVLVPQSMQIVEVSMASYRTAQNSFLDIIDAQRSLLDLQITLASEEARHDIAESNLLRMMGSKAVEGMHGLSSDNTLSEDK